MPNRLIRSIRIGQRHKSRKGQKSKQMVSSLYAGIFVVNLFLLKEGKMDQSLAKKEMKGG